MNENVYKDIGANIVFHRRLRGLTQVVLARNVNIGVGKLSRIERGIDVADIPLSVYLRIAESMSVPIIELLKTTDVKVNICVNKRLVK
ncbi:MAG: helix-turn-helix transcriptional regulator [Phascolarctobacterium sp.]|nr:helix-turn-helix transcriptional regulator [Phascolarctobacterium sp.]MBQ8417790.1 helix-turn-helix transcriptional regulator [Phascolarctobacterium sp.]